jgi:hypothetical protein
MAMGMPRLGHERASLGGLESASDQGEAGPFARKARVRRRGRSIVCGWAGTAGGKSDGRPARQACQDIVGPAVRIFHRARQRRESAEAVAPRQAILASRLAWRLLTISGK